MDVVAVWAALGLVSSAVVSVQEDGRTLTEAAIGAILAVALPFALWAISSLFVGFAGRSGSSGGTWALRGVFAVGGVAMAPLIFAYRPGRRPWHSCRRAIPGCRP